ncbi:MAG: DUF952 domain-containing protein [Dehalococcoidia bacterium]|nr:DUF952 domain-containing protein [Dehalococcoidia bacterium]
MLRRQSTHPVRPPGWSDEGFIHCCAQPLLRTVANGYFRGQPGLVVLGIDQELAGRSQMGTSSAPMEGGFAMWTAFRTCTGQSTPDAVTDVADLWGGRRR